MENINASNQVVGDYINSSNDLIGFLYSDGKYSNVLPPGAVESEGTGINSSGVICGVYVTAAGAELGFTYDGSTYTTVSVPDSTFSWAWDENGAGNTTRSLGRSEWLL